MTMPSVDDQVELVIVGEVAYLLPAIRPDMPPRLRRLLELRRAATIAGRCPRCSASATGVPRWRTIGELVMAHEALVPGRRRHRGAAARPLLAGPRPPASAPRAAERRASERPARCAPAPADGTSPA